MTYGVGIVNNRSLPILAAFGAAALLLLSTKQAQAETVDAPDYNPFDDWESPDDWIDPNGWSTDMSEESIYMQDPRVRAFLWTIRMCEHSPSDVYSGRDYNTFYGGSQFGDMGDHPVISGEKKGVPLPRAMCIAAGFRSGTCVSTAAGAYQFLVGTWRAISAKSPPIPDFSPASQDLAAVRLLKEIGALRFILEDDVTNALKLASTRWASLPYSSAQQNPKTLQYATSRYVEGLENGA